MSKSEGVVGIGALMDGKVTFDQPAALRNRLREMGDGDVVIRFDLASLKAIRSLKANRYYQGVVLKMMADETEQDREDIHDAMCDRFLKRRVLLVNKRTGEVDEHEVARRSSKLSPEDFWDFVERVRLFAAEFLGLTIPDPDPEYASHRRRTAA